MPALNPPLSISAEHLAAVDQPIADASGMPNAAYTEAELFAFERDYVFAKTWTALAFCADHAEAGTVVPIDFMGLPLLIVGGDAPAVFHNVCSHRGRRLVDKPRKTNGLVVCPYHAWSYDLTGALKATPHIGGVDVHTADGFCREKHGLKRVRAHCWMGVIFVNLDGAAVDFDEYAAPLIERYREFIGADGASEMTAAQTDGALSLSAECNWKLAVENYCEAYHLPWVHPSLNAYSPLDRHYCIFLSDNFAGQGTNTFNFNPDGKTQLPLFANWPQDKREVAEYPTFYPNLLLGFQVNHFYALIITPLAADKIREDLRIFYVGDAATAKEFDAARKSNLAAWQKVFREDIGAVEGMQIGRASAGFGGGVFSPVMDAPTHHFHRWVARKYQAGVGG